jgi:hypothetical protein
MMEPFLEAYNAAEMVTGHNILRYDLPVLNGECVRRGIPGLGPKLAQDTMRLHKTKGLKKGQDNLGKVMGVPDPKMPLSWAEWQEAYEEKGWKTVIKRCESDVLSHKLMRQALLDGGYLRPPVVWSP